MLKLQPQKECSTKSNMWLFQGSTPPCYQIFKTVKLEQLLGKGSAFLSVSPTTTYHCWKKGKLHINNGIGIPSRYSNFKSMVVNRTAC